MINNQMAFYFWLKALRKGKFRIENLHVTISGQKIKVVKVERLIG